VKPKLTPELVNRRTNMKLALLACLLFAAVALGFAADKANRADNREAILDGIQTNCETQRTWAVVTRKGLLTLLDLFVNLTQEQIKSGQPQRNQSISPQDFLDQFQPLAKAIRAAPVADCAELRDAVEGVLAGLALSP
jgi:hypothetical protein